MIDPKRIRQNPEEFLNALQKRKFNLSLDTFLQQDEKRRSLLNEAEEKKSLRNNAGKQIGLARKKGASEQELAAMMSDMQRIGTEVERLDTEVAELDTQMENFLLSLPNPPHESVPVQFSAEERICGETRHFLWEPKTHQEIGNDLRIAASSAAAEKPVFCGLGARLERAVANFLLDRLSENGYQELSLPSDQSIVALNQNEIMPVHELPLRQCAYESRSIYLSELVMPEQSYSELDTMTRALEKLISLLGLPCRTVTLCAEKLDFSAAKAKRLEVWMPSLQQFVPAADCTNHEDFIARREGIRCRSQAKEKPRYSHTLSAAINVTGSILPAILENFQNEDGSVSVPEALIQRMNCSVIR
ncbi:MAG: hypothetical protein J6K55_08010 [Clostridia bacterium]|nr:hypothetical protein [Clostridia bacterium]